MPVLLAGIALVLALVLAPSPARAMELRCAQWQGLADAQKDLRLLQRIDEVERGPDLRQLRIDRGALRRCLDAQEARIRAAVDDACADGLEADLDEPEWALRGYIASCISVAGVAPF